MRSLIRLVVCLLLLVGWTLAALSLHVVVTPDQIPVTLVTKEQFGFTDTYVDTRAWTLDDVAQHQALVGKLVRTGRAEVLKHVIGGDKKASEVASRLSDALERAARKDESKPTQPSSLEQAARALVGMIK